MSVFAVIEPKEEYNRQNEAAFREEVRSLGNTAYDKRANLLVPIGKKLQFTSPTGVVVTLGFDGTNFTIQQNTSTPFSLASISYVTTVESGLASRTTALETTVNTPTTGLTARITTEETTRASADTALANRATNLETSVNTPTTGLLARVTTAETAITTETSARASSDTTLRANIQGGFVALGPSDFSADGLYWYNGFGGSPTSVADPSGGIAYADVTNLGRVMRVTSFATYLSQKAVIRPSTDRRYRLTVELRAQADASGGSITCGFNVNGLDTSWGHGSPTYTTAGVAGFNSGETLTVAGGWRTLKLEFIPGTPSTYDAAWRLRLDLNRTGTGGAVDVRKFLIEDVTDITTTNAAVTSASNAAATANSSIATTNTTVAANFTTLSSSVGRIPVVTFDDTPQWILQTATISGGMFRASGSVNYGIVYRVGFLPLLPGSTYEVKARHRVTVDGTNNFHYIGIYAFNASGTLLGQAWNGYATTASEGWVTDVSTLTAAQILTAYPTAVRIVPAMLMNYNNSSGLAAGATCECSMLDLQDVSAVTTLTASVASASSAAATANSSIASLQTLVTARVGSKPASLLVNPAFSDYPTASGSIPPGWTNWSNGTSSSRGSPGRVGAYAHIQDGLAASDGGIYQPLRRMDPGKHNLDIAIERSAGTLTGAGVLIQYFNSSSIYLSETAFSFASITDTRGGVGVSVGYDYRTFRLAFTAPANTYYAHVYLMSHWSGFGSIATYNQIYWHQLDVTPVDYGSATVDALATTVATVDGKLSASYGLTVDAGGRIASMKLLSNGTTSSVKFTASTFQIYDGTTDVPMFEVVGGAAYVAGSKVRTESMTNNAVTSDKINAGAVTASKISVGSLDAITATIGLLRTATSGARTEIESNMIRVYDSSGTLRVRMGIWT